MGAHDPAAAHLLGEAVEIALLESEAAEHLLGLGLDLGIIERVVFRVRLQVLRRIDRAGLLKLVQARLQPRQLANAPGGNLQDGLVSHGLALLRQVADHGPLVALDRPGIRVVPVQD